MEYLIIKSNRKTLSLSINDDLMPVVRAPYVVTKKQTDLFVESNIQWIEKAIVKKSAEHEKYNLSDDDLFDLVNKAKSYIPNRVEYFSKIMGLTPASVKITKAKKRFGSCSGKNGLCFSCYLMLYSEKAIDYVVVHELAHIKHHNHSEAFHNLVAKYLPDYKERIKELKS